MHQSPSRMTPAKAVAHPSCIGRVQGTVFLAVIAGKLTPCLGAEGTRMFRARVILGYIAASSATLFLAARADGRSRAVQSSLEARIAGADVVILGVASQIRTFKKTGADWCIVTVRVDEVFKGLNGPHDVPALRFLEYAEPSSGNWPPLERRFLFFVSRGLFPHLRGRELCKIQVGQRTMGQRTVVRRSAGSRSRYSGPEAAFELYRRR